MELIFEIIIIYLFSYPGALIRWGILMVFGYKKTYKECLKQDVTQNAVLGFLFYGVVMICL